MGLLGIYGFVVLGYWDLVPDPFRFPMALMVMGYLFLDPRIWGGFHVLAKWITKAYYLTMGIELIGTLYLPVTAITYYMITD